MALYLLVDSHEPTRRILRRKLLAAGQDVQEARSGEEALEQLSNSDVDVLLTELRLPEMDGVELLRAAKQRAPLTKQIVLTDYMQVHTLLAAVNAGNVSRMMTKPLKIDERILSIMTKIGDEVVETKQRKRNLVNHFESVLLSSDRPYCLFFEDGTIASQRSLIISHSEQEVREEDQIQRLEFPTQFGTYILYQSVVGSITKPV